MRDGAVLLSLPPSYLTTQMHTLLCLHLKDVLLGFAPPATLSYHQGLWRPKGASDRHGWFNVLKPPAGSAVRAAVAAAQSKPVKASGNAPKRQRIGDASGSPKRFCIDLTGEGGAGLAARGTAGCASGGRVSKGSRQSGNVGGGGGGSCGSRRSTGGACPDGSANDVIIIDD